MESELHKELKSRAIKYLWDKSHYIARPEVVCGCYGIYDVWGIKPNQETIGIEVKVSLPDFRNHRFKENALNRRSGRDLENTIPANRNYILCPSGLLLPEDMHPKYGLLWFNGERLINKKKAVFLEMTDRRKLEMVMLFLSSERNKNCL